MTQSTIREKIFRAVGIKALKEGIAEVKLDTALVVEIARLLCEELRDNFDPEDQYQTEFAKARARGWNQREEKIRNKAQEILKALE